MSYPEYVKSFRPKGCIVRLRNGRYLVFKATSKYVPGKAYPVLKVGELMGWIDSSGFHSQQRILVDFDVCSTFEYGFTNLLLNKEKYFIAKEKAKGISEADARLIYRSMIVSLSPSSYLSVSGKLLSTDEIAKKHRKNVCFLKASLIRSIGMREEEIRLLFSVVAIYDGKTMRTLPPSKKALEILSVYGIEERDIRYVDQSL
jgi:hypothetical protein